MLIETIRGWQLTKMELNMKATAALLQTAEPQTLNTYRDGGSGWTVTEVLGHLRDFERLFLQRAQLTVNKDNPPLPFPNPDELAAAENYNAQPWQQVLDEWQQARVQHIAFLKDRAETDWERPSQHPTRGRFTLHDQLFLTTLHDSIHMEQIARILAEKQTN